MPQELKAIPQKGLAAITEGRYKIVLEESWYHEQPEIRNPDRRWFEQIPCRGGGFIGLYSEKSELIFQLYTPKVKNARFILTTIEHIPGCKAVWLEGEAVIYFPLEALNQVAEMAFARKKRRLPEDHRKRLVEAGVNALSSYRERSGKPNSNVEKMTLKAPPPQQVDLMHRQFQKTG